VPNPSVKHADPAGSFLSISCIHLVAAVVMLDVNQQNQEGDFQKERRIPIVHLPLYGFIPECSQSTTTNIKEHYDTHCQNINHLGRDGRNRRGNDGHVGLQKFHRRLIRVGFLHEQARLQGNE
jgi:hypothetical protein